MAGVGFSLRKLSGGTTYAGMIRLYASAGVISSGPWLISILTLVLVGALGRELAPSSDAVERFQVSVTWLFATSLLLTTPLQLLFTRHVSDLLYGEHDELATPSMWGALCVVSVLVGIVCAFAWQLFGAETLALKLVLATCLEVLCATWIVIVMLTSLREHGQVVLAFALGYAVTLGATLLLAPYGELGLLSGFLLGQAVLLLWSLRVVVKLAPGAPSMAWGFFDPSRVHLDLLPIGLCYGFGIWADKLVFWLDDEVSRQVLGPFRASEVYDFPLFLAYLAITPGMAAFLLQVETDYAERHTRFFKAVEEGGNLLKLERLRDELVDAARAAIVTILKVQGVTFAFCLVFGETFLSWFGISRLHLPLFYVDVAAVSMQVLMLSVISILFYLDRRTAVLWIALLLAVSNTALTLASLRTGALFYGYGFAIAASLTTLVALAVLTRAFRDVLRDTFMMQA
ncbi:MAG: exopolysaccharide Pel transporter PelG [Polyangiales bacterium]